MNSWNLLDVVVCYSGLVLFTWEDTQRARSSWKQVETVKPSSSTSSEQMKCSLFRVQLAESHLRSSLSRFSKRRFFEVPFSHRDSFFFLCFLQPSPPTLFMWVVQNHFQTLLPPVRPPRNLSRCVPSCAQPMSRPSSSPPCWESLCHPSSLLSHHHGSTQKSRMWTMYTLMETTWWNKQQYKMTWLHRNTDEK